MEGYFYGNVFLWSLWKQYPQVVVSNMPNVVLSHKQFFFIVYVYLIGASMIFVPEIQLAGKDAWISTILATLGGMALLAAWLYLQRKFPGLSLVQYGIKLLGPWFGYPVGLYLVTVMFLVATLITEDMVLLTSLVMLPNTPDLVIRATFILVATYACYKGVESIARMCELVFIPLTLLMLVLPIFQWHNIGVAVFRPVWVINWYGVMVGTANSLVFPFAEVLIPAMLLPFVTIEKETEKYYLLSVAAAGVLLLIRTLIALMALGPSLVPRLSVPMISLFRLVELGMFFNRIEGLFLGVWYIGLLLKLAITMYAGVLGLAQLVGIKRLENLWIPVAMALFFVSLIRYPTFADFGFFSFYVLPFLALPGEILYPIILVLVSWVRGRLKPVSVDRLNQG